MEGWRLAALYRRQDAVVPYLDVTASEVDGAIDAILFKSRVAQGFAASVAITAADSWQANCQCATKVGSIADQCIKVLVYHLLASRNALAVAAGRSRTLLVRRQGYCSFDQCLHDLWFSLHF